MRLHHHLDVWLKIPCLVWGALESLRYWRVTQRRVALGLADPLVSASFLAWGISLGVGSARLRADLRGPARARARRAAGRRHPARDLRCAARHRRRGPLPRLPTSAAPTRAGSPRARPRGRSPPDGGLCDLRIRRGRARAGHEPRPARGARAPCAACSSWRSSIPESVTASQMQAGDRAPARRRDPRSGVEDADRVCQQLAAGLASQGLAADGPESPDEIFGRMIRR